MYILQCADGSYYTGSTKDLEKRLAEHQNGEGANHTKKRLPVELLYYEKYDRIDTAFYREKQVQGWSRAKKEALMRGDVDELHVLSECQNETHWLERYSSTFDNDSGLRLADAEPCRSTDLGENKANPEHSSNPERSRRVDTEKKNQAVVEPFDTAQDKLSRSESESSTFDNKSGLRLRSDLAEYLPNPERSRRVDTENETNQPPQTP